MTIGERNTIEDSQSTEGDWERFDSKRKLYRFIAFLIGFVIFYASFRELTIRWEFLATAWRETQDILNRMVPPDVAYSGEIINPLIETVHMSILGTIGAIILALPVAYIGATNTSPNTATIYLGKLIIAGSRSINVIIWAIIFVITFGPGALAGVFALAFRSIGFIAKLLAEAIEEIDPVQTEAMQAVGANGFLVLLYGIVPQIKPAFIGIATYRWDINVRHATVLGFVGAGGIGVNLQTRIGSFDWQAVLTILIAILGIVIISEVVSAYLRRKAI